MASEMRSRDLAGITVALRMLSRLGKPDIYGMNEAGSDVPAHDSPRVRRFAGPSRKDVCGGLSEEFSDMEVEGQNDVRRTITGRIAAAQFADRDHPVFGTPDFQSLTLSSYSVLSFKEPALKV